jgi:UDP-N-acetylglucosamine--N-acetylmuramyl-(pentapeptide) pyrophosphoryl-undecaprenol N-acetylglucosamine transferase
VTTRLLSRWARQVHLGFPEAARHLRPGRRTRVLSLGNPIRPPDPLLERAACRAAFGRSADAVVVLVVGGSQGARALNECLLNALRLVKDGRLAGRPDRLEVLWATGPAHIDSVQSRLASLDLGVWVRAVGYIADMPRALAATDLAVSRAGAMATAELLAWGIPMLLVPLPTAAADHQLHNAAPRDGDGRARAGPARCGARDRARAVDTAARGLRSVPWRMSNSGRSRAADRFTSSVSRARACRRSRHWCCAGEDA